MVNDALGRLSSASNDSLDRGLGALLDELGRALLPPTLRTGPGGGQGPLFVSSDGFLHEFPFGVLGTDATGYRALVETRDVAQLYRFAATPEPSQLERRGSLRCRREGVAVTAPTPSRAFERRFGRLPPLRHASLEIDALRRNHRIRVFTGAEATRDALLERAPRFLYVGAHIYRDPEVPYMSVLPIAPSSRDDPSASSVTYSDIQRADLHGCDLVVLAACASGVGYVEDDVAAKGLSSAFLAAGAAAAVHTLWRVRDDEAARMMTRFIDGWLGDELAPMSALRRAQIDAIHAGTPASSWAAYACVVRSL